MLPKIEYPIHSIKIPSTKKLQNFRPFLVKEEKILLMAKESGEDQDIMKSIKQTINNCCVDKGFNIDDITTTDLGYLFIKLRAVSIDSKVKQSYRDIEDEKIYDFEIDLNKVEIKQDKIVNNNIKITKTMGLILKYPTAQFFNSGENDLIPQCIDKIYDGEEIYDAKNHSSKELSEWIDSLSIQNMEQITEFMESAPHLEYVINYKNSFGNDRKIILTAINDFFSF